MSLGIPAFAGSSIARTESELIPITASEIRWDHNLGTIPDAVVFRLQCVTAVDGYSVGQEIELDALYRTLASDTDGRPAYVFRMDQTSVFIRTLPLTDFSYHDTSVATSTWSATVAAKWRLRLIAYRIRPLQ
jgi:hypothetical protein